MEILQRKNVYDDDVCLIEQIKDTRLSYNGQI